MRLEKIVMLLRIARQLAGSAEGMSLDEIARDAGVDRRTAERMRDALRDLFPTLDEVREGRTKRYTIRGGLDGFFQAPSVDELAELQAAIRALEAADACARAALLRSLTAKIKAALRAPVRRRIEPDLDALLAAQEPVLQAGPRPLADARTLACLREALKASRLCLFDYAGPSGAPRGRRVHPYGLLYGKAYYLVGPEAGREDPVLWRLDRMSNLGLGATVAAADFDLAAYAARSFGAFQEEPADIVLRFSSDAAADAGRFLFHPTQVTETAPDGSLTVRFRSGGLLELVRHLFTWGDCVEIVAPRELRDLMVAELESALSRHDGGISPGAETDARQLRT